MIKIIHVLTDTNIGGAGVWLLNFLKSYNRQKYDICVAVPEKSQLTEKVSELGVKAYEVKFIADKSYSKEGTAELKKLFKQLKPDIVHSHASLSARIAAKALGIKTVNTRHCLEDAKTGVKKLVYGLVNNYLSNIVIGVSKTTCDNLIADGTKKSKVRLVYNGAYPLEKLSNEECTKIKEKMGIPDSNTVIGIVARLEPVKNHKLFLDAAALVLEKRRDVTFLIVGGGSLEDELREQTKELGIENNVIFTGFLADITEAMNVIDINTLTSKKEALSLSLIEGMSINIPAVATNSGGPEEVIEDGISGIIVDNHNAYELGNALIRLIENLEERQRMGSAGEKIVSDKFSIEKMAKTLEGIYDELVI